MSSATVYYASPVGVLRISATGTCISEVHFCNNPEELKDDSPSPPALLQQCREELVEYFQGRRTVFDVPVQQEGTP